MWVDAEGCLGILGAGEGHHDLSALDPISSMSGFRVVTSSERKPGFISYRFEVTDSPANASCEAPGTT